MQVKSDPPPCRVIFISLINDFDQKIAVIQWVPIYVTITRQAHMLHDKFLMVYY